VILSELGGRERVAVVIPALNPGNQFPEYVERLIKTGFTRIFIVDDGSRKEFDAIFSKVAFSPEVNLLRHTSNAGQGASLKTAYQAILASPGEIAGVVTADADGQHAIEDVVRIADSMVARVDSEPGAMVGSRELHSKDIPWKSRLGNSLTSAVVKVLFGVYLVDTQTGLRAFPIGLLPLLLKVKGERFEYNMNVLLTLMGAGVGITSIPIKTIYHDSSNSVSHFRPLIDSLRIYFTIFRQFLKFASSSLTSAAVDLTLFVLFIELLFQGSPEPVSVVTSVFLARCGSTLVNFAVNRRLVFGSKEQKRKTLRRYYALVLLILSASALGSAVLAQVLDGRVVWAKIIVDTTLFFFSYLAQRHWVFPGKRKK
jgi:dolichol-phosphate mannosyltransferase